MSRLVGSTLLMAFVLAACAASNATDNFFAANAGSNDDTYYVSYSGNRATTVETVQTYWLYNCAVFALKNGYEGFEVATSLNVTASDPAADPAPTALVGGAAINLSVGAELVRRSALQDNIKLLKKPFRANPPKVFDAAVLKEALEPYVNGKKCENGNICPHDHSYLRSGDARLTRP
jgi:hypothetical protein